MNASSPASTGPAGQHFEGQVGAYYLLSLLTGAEPRGLPGTTIERVAFQRAADGQPLDDVVIYAREATGNSAILEIQVKRRMTFSPSDQAFSKVVAQIAEASLQEDFSTGRHELAIAISRGSRAIDGAYQDVLTWARQIGDADTFMKRIDQRHSGNEAMRTFVHTFSSHLAQASGTSAAEIVAQLLSRLQILIFDFTAHGSATEDLVKERTVRALHPDEAGRAGELWWSLIQLAIEIASSGGDRTRDRLIEDLRGRSFRLAGEWRHSRARRALAEASNHALADIVDHVGSFTLIRTEHMTTVRNALDNSRYVEIRGDAGVGKSGLLKHLAQQLLIESEIMVLSPGRTVRHGWTEMRAALGFEGTARDLLVDLASGGGTTLFVDGLDFFDEDERRTVADLVREASEVPDVSVIATARPGFGIDEPNWLPASALAKLRPADPVVIGELSTNEIQELNEAAPSFGDLFAENHPAREVVRNLFRLSRLADQPQRAKETCTEIDMAEHWWSTADGKIHGRRDRARLLRDLAMQALVGKEPMGTGNHSSAAVDTLVENQTLRDLGGDQVAFRHDVFRDWAVANWLFSNPSALESLPLKRPAPVSLARGVELAARMALERADDDSCWRSMLDQLSGKEMHGSWRRAVLLAPVRSEIGADLLGRISGILLVNRAAVLRELIRTTMAIDVQPASEAFARVGIDATLISENLNVPNGLSWYRLIRWLLGVGEKLPKAAIPEVVDLYCGWSLGTLGSDPLTPELLKWLHHWLSMIETAHEDFRSQWASFDGELQPEQISSLESNLRTGFLSFCYRTPLLTAEYVRSLRLRRHVDDAARAVMKFSTTVARAAPEELAKLTAKALIRDQQASRHPSYEPFALADHEFFPPSPKQGPFFDLLVYAPQVGQKLIRRIVDHAVAFHAANQPEDLATITIACPDGERVFYSLQSYSWSREWGGFASCITSGLMALEAWANFRIANGESFGRVLADLLPTSDTPSAYLLLAVDLMISHWPDSTNAAVPFVACVELLCLDHQRTSQDCLHVPMVEPSAAHSEGPLTHDSLKNRVSPPTTLRYLLSEYAVSGPSNLREQLAVLFRRASERLGPYGDRAGWDDPSFVARHALNILTPGNWQGAITTHADGTQSQVSQYLPPPEEAVHLQSLSEVSLGQLTDWSIEAQIGLALDDPSRSSQKLAKAAVEWAQRAESIAIGVSTDENPSSARKIVGAAMIALRDGDSNLRAHCRQWARRVFADALRTKERPSFQRVPSRLSFNGLGIAFAGMTHLIRDGVAPADVRSLFEAAAGGSPGAAHGFGIVCQLLNQTDERLPRAILRLALAACVLPSQKHSQTEEEGASQVERHKKRTRLALDAELSWIADKRGEPAWPVFPMQSPRLQTTDPFREQHRTPHVSQLDQYVDHRRAAAWLHNASALFDSPARYWLLDVVRHYNPWTSVANGSEWERHDQIDGIPMEWNAAHFGLMAKLLPAMERKDMDELALSTITSLPDEVFFDVMAFFLPNLDEVYYGDGGLPTSEAVRIRALLADRLTSSRGWDRLRDTASTSIEWHIGPAIAAFFFNDYSPGQTPRSYLTPLGVDGLDAFLPTLEQVVRDSGCFFVMCCVLSLVEVSPRATHLAFTVTAAEAWLEYHPDNREFWVEHGIGRRLCAAICKQRDQEPLILVQDVLLRNRVEAILSALVGLGVAEAARLEHVFHTQ